MLTTLDILTALASGRMSVADAERLLNPPKPIGRNERSAVQFAAPATPPQFRPNTGPKPRPVSPLVSDREVIHAVARGWVVPAKAMELL